MPGKLPGVADDGGKVGTLRFPTKFGRDLSGGGNQRGWVSATTRRKLGRDGVSGGLAYLRDDLFDGITVA